MAKTRMVNTRFWSDTFIVDLDPLDRYLFIYFLTNEHTNISGIYELHWKVMARETGLDDEMLQKMFKRFEGKIYYFDGWVCIKNFLKYQTKSPTIRRGIENEIKNVPDYFWKEIEKNEELKCSIQQNLDTLSIPYPYPMHTASHLNLNSNLNSNSNLNLKREGTSLSFVPPSLQEVEQYCLERQNHIEPSSFLDFYNSKGWMIGRNKMKDWRAAVRTWEKRDRNFSPGMGRKTNVTII